MFGYIRPIKGELKVRDLEHFKACYCGLCFTLRDKYGTVARFILNYELVFLSMLLWDQDEQPIIKRGRCIAGPCRKKCYCIRNTALEICAGYNVILTWWKLRDTISDEPPIKAIPYRLGALILHSAYKKAAREYPEFDLKVREEILSLAEYELRNEQSLDRAADRFAQILKAAVPDGMPDLKRRPLLELLYHLGRWIYIIDAYDDIKEDAGAKRYNPVVTRFGRTTGKLGSEGLDRLKTTLDHSNNLLCSAFELLPVNAWTEIIRNMIYLGMPDVRARVLAGNWPPRRQRRDYNKERI